jgi:hypothetical protein
VQIGEPGDGVPLVFHEACHYCANQFDLAYRRKLRAKEPTRPVLICNLAKVNFFTRVGHDNGMSLVKRGTDATRVCSGPDCVRTDGDKAIAFNGIVHPLCSSCTMASRMAAAREPTLAKHLNPIDDDLAATRARRQAEDMDVERRRLERRAREKAELEAAETQQREAQRLAGERTALQQSFLDAFLTPPVTTRPPRRNLTVGGRFGA